MPVLNELVQLFSLVYMPGGSEFLLAMLDSLGQQVVPVAATVAEQKTSTHIETDQAIYLALVQGLTEFLPISSSGHLVLVPKLAGRELQSVSFDVAVHFGTLIAVVWYFRKQLVAMSVDWGKSVYKRQHVGESKLAWAVLWGTVPAGIFGLLLHFVYDGRFNSAIAWIVLCNAIALLCLLYFWMRGNTTVVRYLLVAMAYVGVLTFLAFYFRKQLRDEVFITALTTLVFGLALFYADRVGRREKEISGIGWRDVMLIGLAQAMAIIPGTSRSGITITMALLLGFRREAAARFSFLLSIPTILLATGSQLYKFSKTSETVDWTNLGIGVVVSAVTAYACIYLFLKLIERIGMLPFVIYRVILAVVLFYLVYIGFFK